MTTSKPHRRMNPWSLIVAFCLQVTSVNLSPIAKWPNYIAANVDANNHNEETLAQHKKILSATQMMCKIKEGLKEANHKAHKVGGQVLDIEGKITALKSKIATPATIYEIRTLQANLELCKAWQIKIPRESAICEMILAKCKEFVDAADLDHLAQRYFSNQSDEKTVDDFEQHGEDWM